MEAVIGVDGGGSQTRVLLADRSGRVLTSFLCKGTNPRTTSLELVVDRLIHGVGEVCRETAVVSTTAAVFGLAGVSDQRVAGRIKEGFLKRSAWSIPADRFLVVSDLEITLAGAFGADPGIVLTAGTGSACVGRNPSGRFHRCGGWGCVLDDSGSGHFIGIRALHLSLRMEDGRSPRGPLRDRIWETLNLRSPFDLVNWIHDGDVPRQAIAGLAPLVFTLAGEGDADSVQIMEEAARELAMLVEAVARTLGFAREVPVALSGGVATSGPPFEPRLEQEILRLLPSAHISRARWEPGRGAIAEALRLAGWAEES